jgi:hypothetical protein
MTWAQVVGEIGGFTPGMLTGLAKAQRICDVNSSLLW